MSMNFDGIVAFIKGSRDTATDNVAVKAKELYPLFDQIKGTYQKKGFRCRDIVDGKTFLYKLSCEDQTSEGTLIVENWRPSTTPAIWNGIDEIHEGTLEDPIPVAVGGMEYVHGKYYIEDGVIYICKREGAKDGDIFDLDHTPSQLIGHYFEVVEV